MPPALDAVRSGSDTGHAGPGFGHSGVVYRELSDQTFIAADRPRLAAAVADPRRWPQWWPDLRLELTRDRGLKGCQWRVAGAACGTAEIYLEPWQDGAVLHLFLRLDCPQTTAGRVDRAIQARTRAWKRTVTRLKDELEDGREPGTAAAQVGPPI